MAWSNLPASAGTDWTSVEFVNQFVHAIAERYQVVGGTWSTPSRWFPHTIDLDDPIDGRTFAGRAFVGTQNSYETRQSGGATSVIYAWNSTLEMWEPWEPTGPTPWVARLNDLLLPDGVREGDYIAMRSLWLQLQTGLQQLVTSFVNSADFPDGFDGEEAIPMYSLATWRSAAGIHADGFTRRYPRTIDFQELDAPGSLGQRAYWSFVNSEEAGNAAANGFLIYEHNGSAWAVSDDQESPVDVLESHGTIQVGDYLGPWIFNELYAGLNALRWTRRSVSAAGTRWRANEQDNPTGWAAAKAAAESAWAGTGASASGWRSWSMGIYQISGGNILYDAVLRALNESEFSGTVPTDAIAHAADLYVWPAKLGVGTGPGDSTSDPTNFSSLDDDDNVFDASRIGLSDGDRDKFVLLDQLDPAATLSRTAPFLDDGLPAWCEEPVGGFHTTARGFQIDTAYWLLRWDVEGGLEYVD